MTALPETDPHVVLVDDDEWLRRALAGVLRANGFGVDLFPCGETLFAGLGDEPPALFILDYQLPRTTGGAIAAALRERFGRKCPPLLLISGSLADVSAEERDRFDRVLAKPFAPGHLLAAVRELVGASSSR